MKNCIVCGMDVHERTIKAMWAVNNGKAVLRDFQNTETGRLELIAQLKGDARRWGCARIVTGYEACCLGFGLYDELMAAGIECNVLAPNRMRKSRRDVNRKTDAADAKMIFETIRGHVLAGNDLPAVWVPSKELRDDREVVRARLEMGNKATKLKAQIGMVLKKHEIRRPKRVGGTWTLSHRCWLKETANQDPRLARGARVVLLSLLRQLESLEEEMWLIEKEVVQLSRTPRYRVFFDALTREISGVGLVTAMVFLTELGDLTRFQNRRQLASFLGLTPTSNETGETANRKGHITRCGPSRVRWVLCQAAWCHIQHAPATRDAYERIRKGKDTRTKIAHVACMRRLAILMWHTALNTVRAAKLPAAA